MAVLSSRAQERRSREIRPPLLLSAPNQNRHATQANDLVKIKNLRRKRSHKRDGIGVKRIRVFLFSSDSAYDSLAYVPLMV